MNIDQQTADSFRDKWRNNQDLAFSETLRPGSDIYNWILERNGFNSAEEFQGWLSSRHRILDAGCGNGRVTALLHDHSVATCEIVGVDLTAADIASGNLSGRPRIKLLEKNLLSDPSDLGRFDLIYCQEVLHHTADPRRAFLNLCGCLTPDGEIAIYVYKKKAPLREYTDDFVRDKVSCLPYEDAMEAMNQITELGRVLSGIKLEADIPEVDILGIDAGRYELQRFLYHFFVKCFWNPNMSFESNAAINYDWYHPQLCTRHTLVEVESWFNDADLTIVHRHEDHYGITVRGVKGAKR